MKLPSYRRRLQTLFAPWVFLLLTVGAFPAPALYPDHGNVRFWNPRPSLFAEGNVEFYQTTWFRALGVLLAGAGLVGIAWRVGHLRQQRRTLEQTSAVLEAKVAERTAELARANDSLTREVEQRKLEVLQRIEAQAKLENRKAALEREIEERIRMEAEVERVPRQLLAASRQAGQAEVATNVLHSVGNVLNSVNVSTALLSERLQKMQFAHLSRAAQLLEDHRADLGRFLAEDKKGRKLPQFLVQLAGHLDQERSGLLSELEELSRNVDQIKQIMAMQQTCAKVAKVAETVELPGLVATALKMHAPSFQKDSVNVSRKYEDVPPVVVDRHKVLHILLTLFQNARLACGEGGRMKKRVVVRIRRSGKRRVRVEVADNGVGIPPENLTRIFSCRFTTRRRTQGHGLHTAALAAREMGGTLTAHSDGTGKGATFTMELPIAGGKPARSGRRTRLAC